ncbi:hypothetical protein [Paenibacillus sp. Marseille-Q4541]|uniref:hypothetical protein n=1 Tax=Paenibacillus sp. Marseille-Q4541 TaxID=2831522 RepID=UPI001BA876B4|nr:hypothetical protein [Paenibacillus sp. Marseille-Q4541]
MDELTLNYHHLDEEEEALLKRMDLCNECIDILIEFISGKGDSIDFVTAEDIVTSIHQMNIDLSTELLHVRLEKGALRYKVNELKQNEAKQQLESEEVELISG